MNVRRLQVLRNAANGRLSQARADAAPTLGLLAVGSHLREQSNRCQFSAKIMADATLMERPISVGSIQLNWLNGDRGTIVGKPGIPDC